MAAGAAAAGRSSRIIDRSCTTPTTHAATAPRDQQANSALLSLATGDSTSAAVAATVTPPAAA